MAPPRWLTAEEAAFLLSKPTVYCKWFTTFPEKPRVLPNIEGELSKEQNQQLQSAIQTRQKEIEVYSRKYYDEQVKPLVQKQLHGRTITKAERLLIIKDTTEDKYKTEDENIKEEIRVHVLALRTLGANSDEEDEAKEGADEDIIDPVVCQALPDNATCTNTPKQMLWLTIPHGHGAPVTSSLEPNMESGEHGM
ncbi:uncharacterized protein B0H18DRAFT_957737 [Fomitopsis serialis]|uniref:uncharacterized protein n=1 Tax=Fomitopsis serialis TaxID=139415 RepID=UPI0020073AD4|nr:uncharacterized protein B0H18DRAFT_957737 [Neoantrodia serialis]KAH9918976.1 hypothetical protein B0H18DRAFT_957737 [Neoantrodia serialis]